MTEKKSSHYRNIGIGVGIGVVVIIAVIAMYVIFTTPTKPKEVTVSGTVATTGTGTTPEKITFTSMRDGNTYVANANGGSYSISLPNSDSYKVTITYKFLGITFGSADAGTLNLDTTETSITRNWAG